VTPECRKEYLFPAIKQYENVTVPCPFGYAGSGASRLCAAGGVWQDVDND